MNNLHRELAPISGAAWAEIEEETARTLKRYLAGRRVVDVPSPGGTALAGVGTGHLKAITAPGEGILARQREVKPLVELRVSFELLRQSIDDVERIVDGNLIWAPAIEGAFIVTTRGGDFQLSIGQDISIGYLSHTDSAVQLYLQETFVFRVLTSEASVALSPPQKSS